MGKLITFAVPCYNSAAYMRACIDTLLAAGEEGQIVIVNDGSSDETGAIADEYAAKYPTIVEAVHKQNGGHGSGVNRGWSARGDFTLRSSTRTTVSIPRASACCWKRCVPTLRRTACPICT